MSDLLKEGQWVSTRWDQRLKRWIIPGASSCASCLGIGLSRPAISDNFQHLLERLLRLASRNDVCVRHKGAWWGESSSLGFYRGRRDKESYATLLQKRALIQIKTGEWAFSSSNSPRYGMPGTMKNAQMHEGFPLGGISARAQSVSKHLGTCVTTLRVGRLSTQKKTLITANNLPNSYGSKVCPKSGYTRSVPRFHY